MYVAGILKDVFIHTNDGVVWSGKDGDCAPSIRWLSCERRSSSGTRSAEQQGTHGQMMDGNRRARGDF